MSRSAESTVMVGKRGLFDEKRRVPAPAQDEEGERSITVWLRSRPAAGAASCVSKDSAGRARVRVPMASDASSSSPHEQQRALAFDFDRVLGQDVVQEDVFGSGVPAFLGRAFSGRDVLISTYGQTSSGKTYTMIGDSDSGEDAGILPRAVRHCFDRAAEAESALEVHVEMVEIYNEELRDLLRSCKADHGAPPPRKLAIRSDPRFGTSIDGLERAREPGPSQALSRIRAALERRATAETGMNRSSSRSHVLCFLLLTDRATGKLVSKIGLADLAGSERQGKTGATGRTLKEGGSINRSLSALERVVNDIQSYRKQRAPAGASCARGPPGVGFRDSKLTRILQPFLTGRGTSVFVLCVSPRQQDAGETLNTMKFGQRLQGISQAVVVLEAPASAEANHEPWAAASYPLAMAASAPGGSRGASGLAKSFARELAWCLGAIVLRGLLLRAIVAAPWV